MAAGGRPAVAKAAVVRTPAVFARVFKARLRLEPCSSAAMPRATEDSAWFNTGADGRAALGANALADAERAASAMINFVMVVLLLEEQLIVV